MERHFPKPMGSCINLNLLLNKFSDSVINHSIKGVRDFLKPFKCTRITAHFIMRLCGDVMYIDALRVSLFARDRLLFARSEVMPLQKNHKRQRRAFLTELTRKRHRLSSPDTSEVVTDTVPVSLDAETGPVATESSVTDGECSLT